MSPRPTTWRARTARSTSPLHLLLAATAYPEPAAALSAVGVTAASLDDAAGVDPSGIRREDADALESLGIDVHAVEWATDAALGAGTFAAPARPQARSMRWGFPWAVKNRGDRPMRFGLTAKRALELALVAGRRLGVDAMGPSVVALAAVDADDPTVTRALAGVDLASLRQQLEDAARRAA